jgi:hypothetical protein
VGDPGPLALGSKERRSHVRGREPGPAEPRLCSGGFAAKLVPGSTRKVQLGGTQGICSTQKQQVAADLLAFRKEPSFLLDHQAGLFRTVKDILLALGAALGPAGLGALDVGLGSPTLHVVATLSLALILFTDALGLDLREAREHRGLAALALGPGTLLSAVLFAVAARWLLGLSWPAAAILGAALASTDPVLAARASAGRRLRRLARGGPAARAEGVTESGRRNP